MQITPMSKYRRLTAAGAVFYQCPVCTYNTHNPTRMKKHLERSCGEVAVNIVEEPIGTAAMIRTHGRRLLAEADKARERVSGYTPEKRAQLETEARNKIKSADVSYHGSEVFNKIRAETQRYRDLMGLDSPAYMTLLDLNAKLGNEIIDLKTRESACRHLAGAWPEETLGDAIQRITKPKPGFFERLRNWGSYTFKIRMTAE